jgi:multidrug efflux pump
LPLAVILVVPMCVLCSIAGVAYEKMDINIFTQVGFVVLIGLACKNAILIVEFAKARVTAGESVRQATLEACQLRLRPILMTSFAFILGVLPLVAAHGAGAEMRQALGTAVFSGMLGVTLFGIFLTPVFFYVIEHVTGWRIFSMGWLPKIGGAALAVLTLKPVRKGVVAVSRRVAAAATAASKKPRLGRRRVPLSLPPELKATPTPPPAGENVVTIALPPSEAPSVPTETTSLPQ